MLSKQLQAGDENDLIKYYRQIVPFEMAECHTFPVELKARHGGAFGTTDY